MKNTLLLAIATPLYFAALMGFAQSALAQTKVQQQAYRPYQPEPPSEAEQENIAANVLYQNSSRQLMEQKPTKFNYMNLRGQYYQTRQYDPLGEDTVQKMQSLAYTIQTAANKDNVSQELAAYRDLLRNHIANIAVASQAISLAKQDVIFGDVDFLKRVRRGLFDSVIKSGDGLTLDGAYDVITMDEETLLLSHLNYEVLTTRFVKTGAIYYNMHYVIERDTQKPYAIFVNTTFAMKHLEKQKARMNSTVILPKRH